MFLGYHIDQTIPLADLYVTSYIIGAYIEILPIPIQFLTQ